MKRYFSKDDIRIMNDNKINLPNEEEIIKYIIKQISKMYQRFKVTGKYYDYIYQYLPFNIPKNIYELKRVKDSPIGRYKYIEDWANELTGEKGSFHRPLTFRDEIYNLIDSYIADVIGVEMLINYDIYIGEAVLEIKGKILGLNIQHVEAIKQSIK